MWGEHGALRRYADVMVAWRRWAPAAHGVVLPCGHHLPEERPDDVAAAVLGMLGG